MAENRLLALVDEMRGLFADDEEWQEMLDDLEEYAASHG